jgi:hypothetical protein
MLKLRQVIQQYKGMIQDFDGFLKNLPPLEQTKFHELYGN